jgi:hypothetical protein
MRQTEPVTKGGQRPLTVAERGVLHLLLSADAPGALALREQAQSVRVVRGCGCGCPSVALEVHGLAPRVSLPTRLFAAEATVAPTGQEPPGNVILFVDDGQLSYLEYVFFSETVPREWPAPDRLALVITGER